jgi:hypothetical protein
VHGIAHPSNKAGFQFLRFGARGKPDLTRGVQVLGVTVG